MRLVAFTSTLADGAPGRRLGIERPDGLLDLTDALGADLGAVLAGVDPVAMLTDAEAEAAYEGQPHIPMAGVRLLAPVAHPGKIVRVGLNYRDHCREQRIEPPAYPTLFAKFGNAISDPGMPSSNMRCRAAAARVSSPVLRTARYSSCALSQSGCSSSASGAPAATTSPGARGITRSTKPALRAWTIATSRWFSATVPTTSIAGASARSRGRASRKRPARGWIGNSAVCRMIANPTDSHGG